jgi:hypothetical protein
MVSRCSLAASQVPARHREEPLASEGMVDDGPRIRLLEPNARGAQHGFGRLPRAMDVPR